MSSHGTLALSAMNCVRPPDSMMSASPSASMRYISRGGMASYMCGSSSISLMRDLSSSVDLRTDVPTISMPISCSAETTDHDFTPPV